MFKQLIFMLRHKQIFEICEVKAITFFLVGKPATLKEIKEEITRKKMNYKKILEAIKILKKKKIILVEKINKKNVYKISLPYIKYIEKIKSLEEEKS